MDQERVEEGQEGEDLPSRVASPRPLVPRGPRGGAAVSPPPPPPPTATVGSEPSLAPATRSPKGPRDASDSAPYRTPTSSPARFVPSSASPPSFHLSPVLIQQQQQQQQLLPLPPPPGASAIVSPLPGPPLMVRSFNKTTGQGIGLLQPVFPAAAAAASEDVPLGASNSILDMDLQSSTREHWVSSSSERSIAAGRPSSTSSSHLLRHRLSTGLRMIKVPNKVTSRPEERLIRILFDAQGMGLPLISWESRKKKDALGRVVDLSRIQEIRLGPNTKAFDLHPSVPASPLLAPAPTSSSTLAPGGEGSPGRGKAGLESRAFSIIYNGPAGGYKMLNLVAPTTEDCTFWVSGLHALLTQAVSQTNGEDLASLNFSNASWLRQKWREADERGLNVLDLDQVTGLLKSLNIKLSRVEVKSMFKMAKITKTDHLSFEAFERFYAGLRFRPEIASLFASIASPDTPAIITYPEFMGFVRNTQRVTWSEERCADVYAKYTRPGAEGGPGAMDMDHFSAFLISSNNSVFRKPHLDVYMDMTRPLCDYYINTSHNTYLLGDQLTGESSLEGYVRALVKGCRSVELDCFDGPAGEPLITHAHTLTGKLLFREVVEAIAKYAFVTSPYPVILSLETHCSLAQQAVMAAILHEEFGGSLMRVPLHPGALQLPSPHELQGRILVKGKLAWDAPASGASEPFTSVAPSSALPPPTKSLSTSSSASSLPLYLAAAAAAALGEGSTAGDAVGASPRPPPVRRKEGKKEPKRCISHPSLKALLVYCKAMPYAEGISFHDFQWDQMCSVSEKKACVLLHRREADWTTFTTRHLARVYPSSFRFTSSNLDPLPFWASGCQMVALNYQTFDRGMQLNGALFAGNGGAGYVLKAPPAPSLGDTPSPSTSSSPGSQGRYALDITILSAQQLGQQGGTLSPVVEVECVEAGPPTPATSPALVFGSGSPAPASAAPSTSPTPPTPLPTIRTKYRTRPASSPSGSPNNHLWREHFHFPLATPQPLDPSALVFLSFHILARDSLMPGAELLGSFCIQLCNLEQGYRHVSLYDKAGVLLRFTTLFVHVRVERM